VNRAPDTLAGRQHVGGCTRDEVGGVKGATRYRVVLGAELSDRFAASFEPMTMLRSDGRTVLVGEIADQSQLHGLLERIASLGIELIAVAPDETLDNDTTR
jgi:hypothetical protein